MKPNKLKIGAAIVLALFVLPSTAQQKQTLRLTLEEAIQIALSENLTIKVADQNVTKSEYAKKGTYAQLFPTVSASGSYQRTIEKQTMYMGANKIQFGLDNSWNGGLQASLPIIAPQLWKSLQVTGMDVELSVEKARASRIDMIEQVTNAYNQVLLAKETFNVYTEAHNNALENFNNVKNKYEVGSTSEYEMIRADVTVKNSEQNLLSAENSVILTKWQLKALLGIDLESEIECTDKLLDYMPQMSQSLDEVSLSNNSSLKQLDIQQQQLQKNLEIQRAANLPTLSASLSYIWTAQNNDFKFNNYKWNPYSVAGLSLNVPIFAGGKRRSDISQAKISLSNIGVERENAERNLKVAVVQYVNNMKTSIKQRDVAKSSVSQAQKGYSIAVKRYEIGNGTQLEINDSQLALTQAQLNLSQSIYQFMSARAAIEKIRGTYTYQPEKQRK